MKDNRNAIRVHDFAIVQFLEFLECLQILGARIQQNDTSNSLCVQEGRSYMRGRMLIVLLFKNPGYGDQGMGLCCSKTR